MSRSVSRFVVGGLIALIVGAVTVGLVATFLSLNGHAGEPPADAEEPDVAGGAA